MNSSPYSVTLKRLIDEIGLSSYYMPVDPEEIHVTVADVDRPGLELIGHLKYYDNRYLSPSDRQRCLFLNRRTCRSRSSSLNRSSVKSRPQ